MKSNYNSLVTQLTGLIEKHKELTEIIALADYDLKWRLSELYKNVKKTDEQKFINLSGMNNYLQTTEQKNNVSVIQNKEEKESKEFKEDKIILFSGLEKKDTEKTWAKSLYRRGVKRCHPDTIRTSDDDYKSKLIEIYKEITEAYDSLKLDYLMVSCHKVLIGPKKIVNEQIDILTKSIETFINQINKLSKTDAYTWHLLTDEMKAAFLENFMITNGVGFVDKSIIKDIVKRKKPERKKGKKPQNKLRMRAKK